MKPLTKTIMEYAEELPEGEVIHAKTLLHLGSRAAVDKALSRLVEREQLLRVYRGFFVRLLEGYLGDRFFKYPPSAHLIVESIARTTGESIAPHPAVTANRLGLTTQNPLTKIRTHCIRMCISNPSNRSYQIRIIKLIKPHFLDVIFPTPPVYKTATFLFLE